MICAGLEAEGQVKGGSENDQSQGTVNLAFNPSGMVANAGDIFTLALMVQAGTQPLNNVELHVDFDPTVLQIVDAVGNPASSIEPDLTTLEMMLYNNVDNKGGHIRYDAGRLTRTPPTGDFRVAQVRFKLLAATKTTIVRFVPPSDVFFNGSSKLVSLGKAPVTPP